MHDYDPTMTSLCTFVNEGKRKLTKLQRTRDPIIIVRYNQFVAVVFAVCSTEDTTHEWIQRTSEDEFLRLGKEIVVNAYHRHRQVLITSHLGTPIARVCPIYDEEASPTGVLKFIKDYYHTAELAS